MERFQDCRMQSVVLARIGVSWSFHGFKMYCAYATRHLSPHIFSSIVSVPGHSHLRFADTIPTKEENIFINKTPSHIKKNRRVFISHDENCCTVVGELLPSPVIESFTQHSSIHQDRMNFHVIIDVRLRPIVASLESQYRSASHHPLVWVLSTASPCMEQLLCRTRRVHEVRFESVKAGQTTVLRMDDSVALLIEFAISKGGPRETTCLLSDDRGGRCNSFKSFVFSPFWEGHTRGTVLGGPRSKPCLSLQPVPNVVDAELYLSRGMTREQRSKEFSMQPFNIHADHK